MSKIVKKNLVIFIVFAMCISLFFSVKPLAVNDSSKANAAVSGSNGCRWVKKNNKMYGGWINALAIDPTNTQYSMQEHGIMVVAYSSQQMAVQAGIK